MLSTRAPFDSPDLFWGYHITTPKRQEFRVYLATILSMLPWKKGAILAVSRVVDYPHSNTTTITLSGHSAVKLTFTPLIFGNAYCTHRFFYLRFSYERCVTIIWIIFLHLLIWKYWGGPVDEVIVIKFTKWNNTYKFKKSLYIYDRVSSRLMTSSKINTRSMSSIDLHFTKDYTKIWHS